jgi:hypothetical protein
MAGDQQSASSSAPTFIEKFESALSNDQVVHTGDAAGGRIAEIVEHPQKILETGQTELRSVLFVQLFEIGHQSGPPVGTKTVAQATNPGRECPSQWMGQVANQPAGDLERERRVPRIPR